MAMTVDRSEDLVSLERGEVNRRIFADPEIFDVEMEQIYGRAWLFVAHESMLARPGDFFEAPMGRDNVLVVRQRDGSLRALLNTCTHRGNAVCRAEEGNTKNFMCTYHGWTFGLDGQLIGVPGYENLYHSELDKSALGLREVAQIDSYKGFVFATMDQAAPPLVEYLGATGRLGIDLIAEAGEMEVVPGIQKYVIGCNWKFAVDNLFDFYHTVTHISMRAGNFSFLGGANTDKSQAAADNGGATTPDGEELELAGLGTQPNIVVLGEYGHAIAGPRLTEARNLPGVSNDWRARPQAKAALGPIGVEVGGHPSIFPNTWIARGQLSLRVPRSPSQTEIWWFTFVDKNASPEQRQLAVNTANHRFGPAGILEQEDGENWAQSTMQTHGLVSRTVPQVLKMNLGRGKVIREHGLARIEGQTTEHGQLWTYGAWREWVSGADWATLKARTTPPEVL
jgi:3-phenylpropionate/trans-cinnamate dioxygenase alpha subunit